MTFGHPLLLLTLLVLPLALMGVYVGRSGWQLERALNADVGRGWRLHAVAEDLADVLGD